MRMKSGSPNANLEGFGKIKLGDFFTLLDTALGRPRTAGISHSKRVHCIAGAVADRGAAAGILRHGRVAPKGSSLAAFNRVSTWRAFA